jgi:hypothetical protein
MPRARRIGSCKVWDVRELDAAADSLPVDGENALRDTSWEDIDAS